MFNSGDIGRKLPRLRKKHCHPIPRANHEIQVSCYKGIGEYMRLSTCTRKRETLRPCPEDSCIMMYSVDLYLALKPKNLDVGSPTLNTNP